MYLRLSNNSFIKRKPDGYLYSYFKNGIRESLVINKSAYEILEICNGLYSDASATEILKDKYKEENIEDISRNISEFLTPLKQYGLVEYTDCQKEINISLGSAEIYYPDIIIWEITDYCPLKCKHCYLGKKKDIVLSRQNIDKIFDIIDSTGIYQVQITGGEALTHPDFKYIIESLIARGIIVSVSTSGIILNKDVIDVFKKLKDVKGSFVKISLDGNKDSHNAIRGNKNSYDNAIKLIEYLQDNKIPCQIGTVIIDQTTEEIEELVSKVRDLGVSLIEIGLPIDMGNAKENNLKSNINQQEFNKFLIELSEKYSRDDFVVKLPIDSQEKNCGAGSKIICIKPNMDVTPCPLLNNVLGNIEKQGFENVMANYSREFNNCVAPCYDLCKECEHKDECKSCIARGINQKDKVKKCYWYESQRKVFDNLKTI